MNLAGFKEQFPTAVIRKGPELSHGDRVVGYSASDPGMYGFSRWGWIPGQEVFVDRYEDGSLHAYREASAYGPAKNWSEDYRPGIFVVVPVDPGLQGYGDYGL